MVRMSFWDKTSDLIFPAGFSTAADYKEKNPWTVHSKVVVEQERGVTLGIHNYGTLCSVYAVPEELEDEAALAYILDTMANQKQEAETASAQPTAEERIAAAMEYQNMMSL